jgi:hypothetical protein
MTLQHLSDSAKHAADALAGVTFVAAFIGWLPEIAAGLSVVWIALRIRLTMLEHRVAEQEYLLNSRKLKQ